MVFANKQASMYSNKRLYIYIAAVLIGIVLVTCAGLVFVLAGTLKLESSERTFFTVAAVVTTVFSLVALGLIVFLFKTTFGRSTEEIHVFLKRFNGNGSLARHSANGDGEIVVALEGMMNELYGLLQSIQIKLRAIDHSMEALIGGIHQVAADQANLFSLNAEIEAARAQRDGFSVITGEILSLVERTVSLTNSIRDTASQLQTKVGEVIVELEDVVIRVDLSQINAPGNGALPGQF
jgi:methyl-accepting chemotaxis protein